ncbi:hypothetical protein FRB95_000623 [Tulasnella sp. JGI-2019a]|nr:hypothetical protein FRB95_000623 [Tulasnella sp. JGI-2019a]
MSSLFYPLDLVVSYLTANDKHHDDVAPLLEKSGLSTPESSSSGTATPSTADISTVSTKSDDKTAEPTPKIRSKVRIYDKGVYTIWEHQPAWTDSIPGLEIWQNMRQFYESWPYFGRFVRDVYAQGPFICITTITAHLLQHIQPTLDLFQASFFLKVIERAVSTKELDRTSLILAIMITFMSRTFEWVVDQTLETSLPLLKTRMRYLFKQRMILLKLRIDLPTSELPDVKAKFEAADNSDHWDAFDHLLSLIGLCVEVALQTSFIYGTLCQEPGGTYTALLSLIGPAISCLEGRAWTKVFHCLITNTAYKRIQSLSSFASDSSVKKEVLGNVMGKHIGKEYMDARKELADKDVVSPWERSEHWSAPQLLRKLVSEAAVVAIGVRAITNPETTPLTSIALSQQTSQAMSWTFWRLLNGTGSVYESFTKLKLLYEMDNIENVIKDGAVSYPRVTGSEEKILPGGGMNIEFKDVSFKYPSTETTVIDKLSFNIAAGSTVVIVGENGCGKSSSIKLLGRLYDVTDGEILIDGLPIKDYKIDDLRAATAIMYQDYHHFDLSLQENIGLGNVARSEDLDIIKEAAKLGGAHDFIERLPNGYATGMDYGGDGGYSYGSVQPGSALEAMIKAKKETQKEFSGGETQRLALSRTFMRSTTCDTRLLAYDEPSAALDPKAEYALFERLRALRGNRTMIFITHRFGYLTKYADLIIYMDKGKAVEQGSHDELLALNGQYAHLYNVQAQAFA